MKPEAIATATALSTAISKAMSREGNIGLSEEELRAKCIEMALQISPTKDLKSILDTAGELATYVFTGYTNAELNEHAEKEMKRLPSMVPPEKWREHCESLHSQEASQEAR